MRLFSDYHTHPQAHRLQAYTPELLQPWADSARTKGLRDIAFTDHDRYHLGIDFDAIEALRENNPDLRFRAGIELDNDPVTGTLGRQWVEKHWDRLDFVLGSVHYLSEKEMFDSVGQEHQFHGRPVDEIYEGYFRRIREMAASGIVDCMSHLDLVKIHGFRPQAPIGELITETLTFLKERNLAIELSTAGWRKPVAEQYPAVEVIRLAKQAGIPFTVASDAHSHVQLAENYARLLDVMRDCGITEVCTFEHHQRTVLPL